MPFPPFNSKQPWSVDSPEWEQYMKQARKQNEKREVKRVSSDWMDSTSCSEFRAVRGDTGE